MCLAVIAAAIAGMQIYLQRGFQARYKAGADYMFSHIEEQARAAGNITNTNLTNINQHRQYDPYYQSSNMTVSTNIENSLGFPNSTINETTTRSGRQSLGSSQGAD